MSIELNIGVIESISEAAFRALQKTGDALRTEVVDAKVMPYNNGTMQNDNTYVESDPAAGTVRIVTDAPQAEHLYIHPEYDFQIDNNPNARGAWLEPWVSGSKADRPAEIFAAMLRKELEQ